MVIGSGLSGLSQGLLSSLTMVPVLKPPEGVTSNFEDPYTRASLLINVGAILMAAMGIVVPARLYTKARLKKLGWDDVTCVLGMFGAIIYYVSSVLAVKAIIGRHFWNVSVAQISSNQWLIPKYIIDVVAAPTYLFTKLTFFLLYLDMFGSNNRARYAIYFGAAICVIYPVGFTIFQFIVSTPGKGETIWSVTLSARYQSTRMSGLLQAGLGVATDFYILILPMPVIWPLNLPIRTKIGITAVFMTGLLACLCSTLSLYYRIRLDRSSDISWALLPVLLLTLSEVSVGVFCSCMPAFQTLIRRFVLPGLTQLSSKLSSLVSFSRHHGDKQSRSSSSSDSLASEKARNQQKHEPGHSHGHGNGGASDGACVSGRHLIEIKMPFSFADSAMRSERGLEEGDEEPGLRELVGQAAERKRLGGLETGTP